MHRLHRLAVVLICAQCLTGVLVCRDRAAARKAYRNASEYHDWLMERPEGKRSLKQYRRAIYLYQLVVDEDPTYGACDDALNAIAGIFDEMARRYSSRNYRNRAIYYYEFVAREYPTSRYRNKALKRAESLRRSSSSKAGNEPQPKRTHVAADTSKDLAVLSDVRYWSNADYTRVVMQLNREVEFTKRVLSDPDRIYFDLHKTRVERRLIDRRYEVNGLFIKQIRVAQNRPDVVRVVLDFERINQHTVFALYAPSFRIVIDTRGYPSTKQVAEKDMETGPPKSRESRSQTETQQRAETSPESDTGPAPTHTGDWTLTRTLGLKVGKVVIDPGHGGKDTGTVGPSGLREKDLVLDIALRLKDLLVSRLGTEVVMTRDTDAFVPLEERTAIANQAGGDLFISIHANASRNRRARGIETYVLDFTTSPAEQEVASRENASAQRTIGELEDLLKQIALGDYNQESRDLAHVVQEKLVTDANGGGRRQGDRGVKQAPFIVLIGSNMPSILTEVGFISNRSDEERFKTAAARQQTAEALYQGVGAYLRSLGIIPALRETASVSAGP